MTIKELMAKRAAFIDSAKSIEAKAKDDKRDLTAEELTEIGSILDQADATKAEIAKEEALTAIANRLESNVNDLSEVPEPQSIAGANPGSGNMPAITNVRDLREDDRTHGFLNLGDFAASVLEACNPQYTGVRDDRLEIGAAITNMGQTIGSDGGFLVPPEFSTMIWDGLNRSPNNLLSMTDNFTITGESITIPANAETSRATGSRYGGVQGFWIAEADQISNSNPKFRQVKLEPQQLAVLVFVTDKLLRNSMTALAPYLTRAATDEINFLVGDAIINGDGVGKPSGILNSSATVSVAKISGQTAKTVVTDNIHQMYARLHFNARAGAVWFVNQDVEPQLSSMGFDLGNGGVPLFLPANGLIGQPVNTLKGLPIMPIEFAKTLGTEGDIILANMSGYATATRGSIDSASSIHLRFDFAETAFRFMFEVDGQTFMDSPLTPFNGTDTTSHFVTLAVRA